MQVLDTLNHLVCSLRCLQVIKTKLGEYVKMEAYLKKTTENPFILKGYK